MYRSNPVRPRACVLSSRAENSAIHPNFGAVICFVSGTSPSCAPTTTRDKFVRAQQRRSRSSRRAIWNAQRWAAHRTVNGVEWLVGAVHGARLRRGEGAGGHGWLVITQRSLGGGDSRHGAFVGQQRPKKRERPGGLATRACASALGERVAGVNAPDGAQYTVGPEMERESEVEWPAD